MNRYFLLFICISLSGCGGGRSVNKSEVVWNAENYSSDALQAYTNDEWALAKKLFSRALILYQSIDEQSGVLTSHINLVEVALSSHDYQLAKSHLNWLNKSETEQKQRVLLLNAIMALQQKKIAKAIVLIQPLLPQDDDLNNINGIQLAAVANRAKLAFIQKKDEVVWTQRYADALNKTDHQTDSEGLLLRFQARLSSSVDDYEQAENKLQQVLLIYKNSQSRQGIAITLFDMAELCEKQKQWQCALAYLDRSIAVFKYLKNTEKVKQIESMASRIKMKLTKMEHN